MKTIIVDGVEFVEKSPETGDLKIVILDRGNVLIGRLERLENDTWKLTNASVIRCWGTLREGDGGGLGLLAREGRQEETILDPCGTVEFPTSSLIATIECEADKWTQ